MRARNSVVLLLASLCGISGGVWGAAADRTPRTVEIAIDNLAFGPAPALHLGDTVEWVNRDIFRHSATASGNSFDIDLPAGASARFTPRYAGTFAYICKYHPGMKGTLVVLPESIPR